MFGRNVILRQASHRHIPLANTHRCPAPIVTRAPSRAGGGRSILSRGMGGKHCDTLAIARITSLALLRVASNSCSIAGVGVGCPALASFASLSARSFPMASSLCGPSGTDVGHICAGTFLTWTRRTHDGSDSAAFNTPA